MRQATVDSAPVDVGEKRFDVLGPLSFEVEQISVFPNVHDEYGIEAGDIARFMERDPVI